MRRTPLFTAAVLAAALFLVACGDDNDPGGGHMDGGPSGNMGQGGMGHGADPSPVVPGARRMLGARPPGCRHGGHAGRGIALRPGGPGRPDPSGSH